MFSRNYFCWSFQLFCSCQDIEILLAFWYRNHLFFIYRDNYDKEVKEVKQDQKRSFNPFHKSSKRPDAGVYIPPSRKENPEQNEQELQEQSSG